MRTDLKPGNEELLLCRLCRLSFDDRQKDSLKELTQKINDWSKFLSLAGRHGISAMVYGNMAKLGLSDHIPPEISNNLWNTYMLNLARNSVLTARTGEVLDLLNSQNIKTVLLKGIAIESTVYGNTGLRQMTDVDILVSREDSLKARQILIDNGFVSNPLKSVLYKPILAYVGKHLPTLTKDGFAIEIHNDLFGAEKRYLTGMLYDDSIETEVAGKMAYIPDPGMFFIYLVRHLRYHEMNNESQLRLYADLVVLLEKYGDEILDPDLPQLAADTGMSEMLSSYLRILRDVWSIAFPKRMNYYIDRWSDPGSVDKFFFFLKSPKDNPPPDKAGMYRYHVSGIPGFHRKLLFVLGDLFPTVAFMKKRYGYSSNFKTIFYYPLRLGKLWYLVK